MAAVEQFQDFHQPQSKRRKILPFSPSLYWNELLFNLPWTGATTQTDLSTKTEKPGAELWWRQNILDTDPDDLCDDDDVTQTI